MTFIPPRCCWERIAVLVLSGSAPHSSKYGFKDDQQPPLGTWAPLRAEKVKHFVAASVALCISITLPPCEKTVCEMQHEAVCMLTSVLPFLLFSCNKSKPALFSMQAASFSQHSLCLPVQTTAYQNALNQQDIHSCVLSHISIENRKGHVFFQSR